jgi:4-hydroxy-4-methyl-2-oxoglutarate aldolase
MPRRPTPPDNRRPSSALPSGLRGISVATAHEALGRRGLMDPGVRPIVAGTHVAGPAITAWCAPDDNLAMHVALSVAQADDVLVVHSAAGSLGAQWGALVTHQAIAIGLAGVVTDGSTPRRSGSSASLSGPVRSRRGERRRPMSSA